VREGDTVARIGGDEFVVMLEDLSENTPEAATHAKAAGEKILAMLNATYQLDGNSYRSTASIGITLFANFEQTVDELIKQADLAMYQAKAAGRSTLRFFDPQMQATVTTRAALEADLREAVAGEQFVVHYQPQVDLFGRVTGAEALLRWRHPRRGLVYPGEFIGLAEEAGLIVPIGWWVLETVCRQLAVWTAQPSLSPLTVAVNVSPRQFREAAFVDQVVDTLARTGANARRLKLEVTENLLVDDMEVIINKMAMLKAIGVSFSLDDFGTGYSSLSYLKRMPLDQLKIDRSFVRDILIDPNDAAIAKMIIVLADSLGLAIIAEGVETAAQREFLLKNGCPSYQGYFFGHPLPIDEFEIFVAQLEASPGRDGFEHGAVSG
jgi:predicted signal transduction protein with EAL and GGDEF domain